MISRIAKRPFLQTEHMTLTARNDDVPPRSDFPTIPFKIGNPAMRQLFIFAMWMVLSASSWAAESKSCATLDARELEALGHKTTVLRSFPAFPTAPAGGVFEVAVKQPEGDDAVSRNVFYRVVMDAEGTPRIIEDDRISARPIPEDHWLLKAGLVGKNDSLLRFSLPILRNPFLHSASFTIVGCAKDKPDALFASRFDSPVSDGPSFLVLCALVTVIMYGACAYWCKGKEDPLKLTDVHRISYLRYLDPVILSAGPNGKGSLSRLQVLFFTVIVFFTMLYGFLRVGVLSDLSVTVLGLLGISAVGAAAARATDVQQNRLDWANWTWLVQRGWLPKNGLAAITQAKWQDLVTGDDGFDIYHFQMLIFSLLVGVALLLVGFNDLASFKIPDAILAMLGLSQIVYLGGKLAAPPSCKDLDKGITTLRNYENAYLDKLRSANVNPPPATEDAASTAVSPEFSKMKQQLEAVKVLFASVMGEPQADAKLTTRLTDTTYAP